jgi:hypothetical protein
VKAGRDPYLLAGGGSNGHGVTSNGQGVTSNINPNPYVCVLPRATGVVLSPPPAVCANPLDDECGYGGMSNGRVVTSNEHGVRSDWIGATPPSAPRHIGVTNNGHGVTSNPQSRPDGGSGHGGSAYLAGRQQTRADSGQEQTRSDKLGGVCEGGSGHGGIAYFSGRATPSRLSSSSQGSCDGGMAAFACPPTPALSRHGSGDSRWGSHSPKEGSRPVTHFNTLK